MRVWPALLGLCLATAGTSCAFLLDFDELQSEPGSDAGGVGGGGTGGTSGAAGAGGTPPALDEIASAVASRTCKRLKGCRGPLFPVLFGEEDCEPHLAQLLRNGPLADIEQIPAARFSYHPELMGACLSALETAPCDVALHWPKECDAALDGSATAGGACVHSLECPPDHFCSCPGTCVPAPTAGKPCASGICARGLYCDRNGLCQKPLGEGAPCSIDARCTLDKYCLGPKGSGQCKSISTVFDSTNQCDWALGDLCKEGYFCAVSTLDLDAGTNGSCVGPANATEKCTISVPDSCPKNFFCSVGGGVSGFCTALPGADKPCTAVQLKGVCASGSRCVGRDETDPSTTPGTCRSLIANGDACGPSEQCYSNLCVGGYCRSPHSCVGWK